MSLLAIYPSSVTAKPFYEPFFSSAEQTLCDLLQRYGKLDNKPRERIINALLEEPVPTSNHLAEYLVYTCKAHSLDC